MNLSQTAKSEKTQKKSKQGVNNRVAMLGDMDDRRKQYLGVGDKSSLLGLADEYYSLGMVDTASQIRHEANNL